MNVDVIDFLRDLMFYKVYFLKLLLFGNILRIGEILNSYRKFIGKLFFGSVFVNEVCG